MIIHPLANASQLQRDEVNSFDLIQWTLLPHHWIGPFPL